jgi:hypothetical protein
MTSIYLMAEKMIYQYHTGQDLTSEAFEELATKAVPCFGTIGFGFLQLFKAKIREERLEALRIIEEGISEYSAIFGDVVDPCLGAFLLAAYYRSEDFEKGINYANTLLTKLITNGHEGAYGISEILRLKVMNYKTDCLMYLGRAITSQTQRHSGSRHNRDHRKYFPSRCF